VPLPFPLVPDGKAQPCTAHQCSTYVARCRLSETHRLQQVKEHPSYKADPLGAIAHHLQATLPPAKKPPAKGGAKQQRGKGASKAGSAKQRQNSMQTD
jgi:hypothetical protein